jgi:hypothetical protein
MASTLLKTFALLPLKLLVIPIAALLPVDMVSDAVSKKSLSWRAFSFCFLYDHC